MCDRLQCVCDRTTAECMAASHFNHSLNSQCSGPRPPCVPRPRPPPPAPPTTDTDSSQESSESTKPDLQTLTLPLQRPYAHNKPGGSWVQEDVGKPKEEEGEGEEEEGEDEEI